ncbi:urate hydroxylase PuuD [Marinimicrobium sp. ARAG 43.8]|uniref:urate hydroxylase PuuD n=1 Tax=Marinimicrobium sp. ARAG 43.8 TaxID=3418719 RepID=UPI003CF6F270
MSTVLIEWLNLGLRWFHVVAGIAWIGASFYFIWLDLNLREPPRWKKDQGIKGDLWAIHGGGIYEIGKYQLRPKKMPERLHWFKWEAYSTWLSGTLLLIAFYYVQARSYLVGPDSWVSTPEMAIVASIAFIVGGQLLYEMLLRTALVRRGLWFAVVLVGVIALASWLAQQLFSGRAAFLHVGALIATWMAGNVFWGIIPAQKKFIAAVSDGREPDPAPAVFAKLRSTHNNYLTLPVIFCMISNHYPFLYGSEYSWLLLLAIGVLLAWGRHFFNLKHQGIVRPGILVSSGLGLVLVAVVASWAASHSSMDEDAVGTKMSATDIDVLIDQHCTNCHSPSPTQPGFQAPPAGLVITDTDSLLTYRTKALPALHSHYMPLGNMTGMSDEQRSAMVHWLEQQE